MSGEVREFGLDDLVNVADPEHEYFGVRAVVIAIRSDDQITIMTGRSGSVLTLPAPSLMPHATFVARMAEADMAGQAADDRRLIEAAKAVVEERPATPAGISASAFTSQTVVSLRCSVCGERYHQWGGDGANVFDDMPQAVKAATAEGWTITLAPLAHEGRDHATFAVCPDGHRSHADARFLMLPPAPEIATVMDGQVPLPGIDGVK